MLVTNKYCKYYCVVLNSFGQTDHLTIFFIQSSGFGLMEQLNSDDYGIWVFLNSNRRSNLNAKLMSLSKNLFDKILNLIKKQVFTNAREESTK